MIGGIQMDQSIVSRARDEPIRTNVAIRAYRAEHPDARYINVHAVNSAINAGELPHFVRPGGQVRYIRPSDLESWATKSFVSM